MDFPLNILFYIEPAQLSFWIVLVFVLIVLSALFSGSEVAYTSLNSEDIESLKSSKNLTSRWVVDLHQRYKYLLSTLLLLNNLVNVAIIILSSYILLGLFSNLEGQPLLKFFIEVILITSLILLFGEIAPKEYAYRKNKELASFMSIPLKIFSLLFHPVNYVLVSTTSIIEKRLEQQEQKMSAKEFSHAIDLTMEKNIDDHEERKILKGLIDFGNTSVKQIMCNRMNVMALDINEGFLDILEKVRKSGYSRIPVYQEKIDNIQGVIYSKDLIAYSEEEEGFEWSKLIRKPIFVPENKKISNLLKDFQSKKIHLAIVVDEYGGTSGIVTLEDVLEEIVGDIKDEFDQDSNAFVKITDQEYVFDSNFLLSDITKLMDLESDYFDESKGDADSIGGLVLEITGQIPGFREKVPYRDYLITVESVGKKSIKRLRVTKV